MKSIDIPVHDVAPLLEVREYSFYWFMLLVTLAVGGVLLLRKKRNARKISIAEDIRRVKYERLAAIDLKDSKAAAYAISEQGLFFAQEDDEVRDAYRRLFEHLERYKYALDVEAIDEETLELYRLFLQKILL